MAYVPYIVYAACTLKRNHNVVIKQLMVFCHLIMASTTFPKCKIIKKEII